MSVPLLTSTVMVQDGSRRLVHLVRTDDGLYTLKADAVAPSLLLQHGAKYTIEEKPFSVDVTQAVLWAAQFEAQRNTAHWSMILARMQAGGLPLPSHLREDQNNVEMRLEIARIKARQEQLWEELRQSRENFPDEVGGGETDSNEATG